MELNNFTVETHQGPFLNVNEDGYHFDLEQNLFMIFDGYGGSNIGDKAVEELERAVNLKPTDPIINDHLGDAYLKVNRELEALYQWKKAIQFNVYKRLGAL